MSLSQPVDTETVDVIQKKQSQTEFGLSGRWRTARFVQLAWHQNVASSRLFLSVYGGTEGNVPISTAVGYVGPRACGDARSRAAMVGTSR